MAAVTRYMYSLTVIDSQRKLSTFQIRVNEVDAAAWLEAADETARGATDIGVFQTRILALTAANFVSSGVQLLVEDDAYAAPAADDNVYHFDKLTVGYKVGLRNYVVTIPARDDAAYTVANNGVEVILSGGGAAAAITNFIASFEAVAYDVNGDGPVDVTYIRVSS